MSGTTTPRLGLPLLSEGQVQPSAVDATAKRILDLLVQAAVISITNTPPGSPVDGDAYIIGTSPTGAWAGRANNLVLRVGGGWFYEAPGTNDRFRVFNRADGKDYRWSGTAWAEVTGGGGGSRAGRADVPPASGSFTWQNQGGASVANYDFGMTMTVPYSASLNVRSLLVAAPTAPYRRRLRFSMTPWRTDVLAGIVLRESGTGKLIVMGVQGTAGTPGLYFNWYNSDTSFNSAKVTTKLQAGAAYVWLSLYNDNTNHIFQTSPDGESWTTIYSEAKGAFITPTHIGIHGINLGTSSEDQQIAAFSWE
jgi:hypothetical protein